MAEKGFGVKEVNLIGASGTPTITSPNNLNLNAVNVAISTNASIGGNLTVSGTVGIAGTLTYEDVTNVDAVGIVTARDGIFIPDNKKLELGNAAGSGDLRLYHDGSDSYIQDAGTGDLIIKGSNNLDIKSAGDELKARFTTNGSVQLYHNDIERLRTYNEGVQVLGAEGGNAAILIKADEGDDNNDIYRIIAGNGTNLFFQNYATGSYVTNLKLTGDGNGAVELNYAGSPKLQTTSSGATVTGTLAATAVTGDGSGLTGIAVTEAPVTDYTVSANGSSAYRFHGGGVDETADNPNLYLIRGQKYRFNNTTGSSHPFAIREADGGSAYSNGVSGDDEGVQFFTVPYDAPARIYYQCTIHGGMVGNIYIRGANGNNDYVGLTTFRNNVRIAQPAGTDATFDINEGTTTNALRIMQTATEGRIINNASIPFNIRSQGGSGSNAYLAFWTRESERLRIAPDGTIHVNSSDSASGGRIYATGSALYLQSGNGRHTFKVSDTSAGNNRTIEMTSAGNLKFPAGATIGIDFSAKSNLGGATDTTLAHYEEGTWTPTMTNLNNASHVTTNWATYTRVGRIVTISVKLTISSSVNDASGLGFNLPYGPISNRQIVIPAISDRSGTSTDAFAFINILSDHNVYAKRLDGFAFQSYNLFSGNYIIVTGSYETDA